MKLSEAIRVGSTKGPQVRGSYTALVDGHRGYCVVGAALAAVNALSMPVPFWVQGGKPQQNAASMGWNETCHTLVVCPGDTCDCYGSAVVPAMYLLSHLNDYHGWTRERIADWVASIERANSEAVFLNSVKSVACQPLGEEPVAG